MLARGRASVAPPLHTPAATRRWPLPVRVTIPAGQTYAFYVTSTQTSVSLNYGCTRAWLRRQP